MRADQRRTKTEDRKKKAKEMAEARRRRQAEARKKFDVVQPEAIQQQIQYVAKIKRQTDEYLKMVREEVVPQIPMFTDLEPDQMEDEVEKSLERVRSRWTDVAGLAVLIARAGSEMELTTRRKFNEQVTKATGLRVVPQPANSQAILSAWVKRNASLFSNAVRDHSSRLTQVIAGGIAGGRPVSAIVSGVSKAAGILSRRNANIAVDQSQKLGSQLNTARMQEIGVRTFTWISMRDTLVRPLHEDIDGNQYPVGVGHPQEGMPGDPVNCFPGHVLTWSPSPITKKYSRIYRGDIIVLSLKDRTIEVTPNHPILTGQGFKRAADIDQSDYLMNISLRDRFGSTHDHRHESRIDEIGNLIESMLTRRTAARFHGDVSVDDEVNIEFIDRRLGLNIPSPSKKDLLKHFFSNADGDRLGCASGLSSLNQLFMSSLYATDSIMSGASPLGPHLRRSSSHSRLHALAAVPDMDTASHEPSDDDCPGYPNIGRDGLDGLVLSISPDKVLNISRFWEPGCHVYNLETDSGWYVAGGVLVSNCRCSAAFNIPSR